MPNLRCWFWPLTLTVQSYTFTEKQGCAGVTLLCFESTLESVTLQLESWVIVHIVTQLADNVYLSQVILRNKSLSKKNQQKINPSNFPQLSSSLPALHPPHMSLLSSEVWLLDCWYVLSGWLRSDVRKSKCTHTHSRESELKTNLSQDSFGLKTSSCESVILLTSVLISCEKRVFSHLCTPWQPIFINCIFVINIVAAISNLYIFNYSTVQYLIVNNLMT